MSKEYTTGHMSWSPDYKVEPISVDMLNRAAEKLNHLLIIDPPQRQIERVVPLAMYKKMLKSLKAVEGE